MRMPDCNHDPRPAPREGQRGVSGAGGDVEQVVFGADGDGLEQQLQGVAGGVALAHGIVGRVPGELGHGLVADTARTPHYIHHTPAGRRLQPVV